MINKYELTWDQVTKAVLSYPQVPVSRLGFSQHALLTQRHTTWSIIRPNFTQMLSVWFTLSCKSLFCINLSYIWPWPGLGYFGSAPAGCWTESVLKYLGVAWNTKQVFLFNRYGVKLSLCQPDKVTTATVSNLDAGWNKLSDVGTSLIKQWLEC